jgi:hypothetical protein
MRSKHNARLGLSLVVALVCGAALPGAADASSPKLKLATAKKVTKEVAVGVGTTLDGTVFGDGTRFDAQQWSVGPCSRKSRRRIVCRYDVYAVSTAPDGTSEAVNCWDRLIVKYAGKTGRKIRIGLISGDCRLDPGGSSGRHALPAEG